MIKLRTSSSLLHWVAEAITCWNSGTRQCVASLQVAVPTQTDSRILASYNIASRMFLTSTAVTTGATNVFVPVNVSC